MNQSIPNNNRVFFFKYLEENISKTLPGQSIVITYNGVDTICFEVAGKIIYKIDEIHNVFANEVENFLKEKSYFSFRKFRISPHAFEAYFRKPKL